MELSSPAFAPGGAIPAAHGCDGADASPPLAWRDLPAATKALALIVDDPDAPRGTWLHWTAWNLPPAPPALDAGLAPPAADGAGPGPIRQGLNDFGRLGWGGPCPPSGEHRYVFRLFALDGALDLADGATRADLDAAMRGRVLAEATLLGTYRRQS